VTLSPPVLFVIFIVVFAGVLVAMRVYNRKRLLPLAELLDEHSGEVTGAFTFTLAGHFRGREAAFTIRPGGKNRPPKFYVGIRCGAPVVFEIYKEGIGMNLAKKLHLLKDVEVGDPALDAKYVFSTKEPETFSAWVLRPEVRDAVTRLLDAGNVDRLEFRNGFLCTMRTPPGRESFEPDKARGILESLETLVKSLEA
jgi:hypothetical protein